MTDEPILRPGVGATSGWQRLANLLLFALALVSTLVCSGLLLGGSRIARSPMLSRQLSERRRWPSESC